MTLNPMSWLRNCLYGPRVPDQPPGPSEELEATARDLRYSLQPYLAHPDPLVALMTDIFNKRQLQQTDLENKDEAHGWF